MHAWRSSATPLHGTDTVPTRTLREEVVLELLKFKAAPASAFTDVCVQIALSVHFKSVWLSKTTLLTWKGGPKQ